MTERTKTYRLIAAAGGARKRPRITGTRVAVVPSSAEVWRALLERLAELESAAEDEGIHLSEASEHDLKHFLSTHSFSRRPYLSLLENGNLRVLWKNAEGEQIGLQFRGGQEVQFVLFAKRHAPKTMARSAGRDTLAGIDRQIDAADLWRLLRV